MTRERRRILAKAGAAIVALVGTLIAWSFFRIEMISVSSARPWQFDLFDGVVYIETVDVPVDDHFDVTWQHGSASASAYYWKFRATGMDILGFSMIRPSPGYVIVGVPLWPIFVGAMAAWWAWRERPSARKTFAPADAKCPACGYGLRESVDHCPECGSYISCATVAQQREVLAAAARLGDATHATAGERRRKM